MNLPTPVYLKSKEQDRYPSGSTISYLNDHFYIMGDDASHLLVLNSDLQQVDGIPLFPEGENLRIAKEVKSDIESSAVINYNGKESVLLFGSGSVSGKRDSGFLVDPLNKSVERLDLSPFYNVLREHFEQLNIEGAAKVGENLLLGIRGNRSSPKNYLAIASVKFPLPQFKRKIAVSMPVRYAGLSGLDYDASDDLLFITFSTEDTATTYDDGKTGDSYLAIVPGISGKLKESEIMVSSFTKLTDLSEEFLQQKIESVSLIKERKQLLLVSDDDLGNTGLFILQY